jgi:hypothetical protein
LRKAGSDGRKKKNAGFEELIHEQMCLIAMRKLH